MSSTAYSTVPYQTTDALRIAQVAPLVESVPPPKYGGTERVVSVLTEGLVRRGHEVTLYASADSITTARLRPIVRQSLRLDPTCESALPYHLLQLEEVMRDVAAYDIIHFHEGYLHYSLSRRYLRPTITTMHGRLDLLDYIALQRAFDDIPVVSISYSQRRPMPWANWVANIYHGYDADQFTFSAEHSNYLLFLGRLSPEKRPDRAIKIAIQSNCPLIVAAKIDKADRDYYEQVLKPLLTHPLIEFVGEVEDQEKQRLLGGALGVLLPIDWPEPFGLTLIEAMACGTPTIAFRAGSVPEILEHEVTGFIVDSVDEATAAVEKLETLDRQVIRRTFEKRFSANRMVDEYLQAYATLIAADRTRERVQPVVA